MNKLVLLGNGFDLAHGLETSYGHFITWYLNKARMGVNTNHFHKDDIFEWSCKSPIENSFKKANDFLDLLPDFKKRINYIHEIFPILIQNFSLRKWVDIESYYYSHVLKIMNMRGFEKKDSKEYEDAIGVLKKLNSVFDALKNELIEYLDTIDTKDLYNGMIERNFDKYICSIDEGEHNNKLFLNFNYTSTIRNYRELFRTPPGKVGKRDSIFINIHGSLKDESNPVIFGYGDEKDPHYPDIENLNENEFLKNIKSFWYSQTGNYQALSRFIEAEKFKVFILGHSCGISDRILLKSIFEHDNCKSIQIFYHKRADGTNDYFEKTQEISRHYSAENKHAMRNKIVPFDESCALC